MEGMERGQAVGVGLPNLHLLVYHRLMVVESTCMKMCGNEGGHSFIFHDGVRACVRVCMCGQAWGADRKRLGQKKATFLKIAHVLSSHAPNRIMHGDCYPGEVFAYGSTVGKTPVRGQTPMPLIGVGRGGPGAGPAPPINIFGGGPTYPLPPPPPHLPPQ